MKTKQYGLFVMKDESNTMIGKIENEGFDIFEVRPLTIMEKMVYIKDTFLFVNEPHIIMFNAKAWKYKRFLRRNKLQSVF